MIYSKKKMTEVADNPRGFWGRKMLNRMNDRHKNLIKWGLEGLDLTKYRDVLDIGCGSGNSLDIMYRKNKKAHFFGLDYSKDSVKMAKKNNKDAVSKGHMKIIHGDVCDMPYKNDSFDLIVSVESFYYWKKHEKALSEIARVMKKNGKLVIILEAHKDIPNPEKHDEIKNMLDMLIPGQEDFEKLFEKVGLSLTTEKKEDWIKAIGIKK